jgi:PST family polysaccharide transporter
MSLNSIVNYGARNGDNVVVGRWLGATPLGLYARAYNLMMLPQNYFTLALSTVLFPAFCEIRDDTARLAKGYFLAVQVSAMVAAPTMAVLIVAAPHLVTSLYGEAWRSAAVPLQILCAVGVCRTVYHVSGAVTQASGQVYAELRRQIVYAALVIGGAIAGMGAGITGVAIGVSAAIVYMYLAMARLSLRITGLSWAEFFNAQVPGLVIGAVVALAAVGVRLGLEEQQAGSLTIVAAVLVASGLASVVAIYLLPRGARPMELFAKVESATRWWPPLLRGPIRRMLRVSA